jgi:hypothetical protein
MNPSQAQEDLAAAQAVVDWLKVQNQAQSEQISESAPLNPPPSPSPAEQSSLAKNNRRKNRNLVFLPSEEYQGTPPRSSLRVLSAKTDGENGRAATGMLRLAGIYLACERVGFLVHHGLPQGIGSGQQHHVPTHTHAHTQ